MPATPNKLNLNFARNNYNVFGQRPSANQADQQQEQKTELLEGNRENGLLQLKSNVDYINLGEEDQMEIYGYKRNYVRTAITWFLIVATGGLLRLFFHWFPRFMLVSTHSHCPLKEADTVLLLERFQEKHTSFYVKRLKSMTAEEVVKYAIEEEALGNEQWTENGSMFTFKDDKKTLLLSIHLAGGMFKNVESIDTFTCKKLTYVWDPEKCEFLKLRGLDSGVFTSTLHQMPVLSAEQQYMRRSVYGNNEIVVPIKSILTLLCLEVLNPFYVFQTFSFVLWITDEYVYYAMAILFISSVCVAMEVFQTRKNQRNLRSTVSSSDVATVLRDRSTGLTATIPAEHLVPGDILVIPSHGCQMPCDAVLITGNCILNESMLTGESVPVTKTPIPSSNDMMYDTKEHARHTLFCGTRVLQTRYFGTEKVLAVVIRTGFSTSKGGLVRSIMYPPPVDFKFEQDSYKFVILLAVIASVGMIYTIVSKSLKGIPARDITLEALDLITIVVPPALPAAMTVGRHVAQSRLKKKRIYCTSPRAVNVSGSIDCVCFDKTGTLTEDGLDMWGIVPVSSKKFQFPVKDVKSLPLNETLIGMVTCHGITIIENQLVGDPLDLKMFESTGWILEEPDVSDTSKFSMLFPTVVRPPCHLKNVAKQASDSVSPTRQNSLVSDAVENISLNNLDVELTNSAMSLTEQGVEVGIVRQFPFTSSLQRMSVITRTLGANHYDLYCKGSPEVILSLSKPESIPSDFDSVLQEYTSEGYRVIALAYKSLKRLPYTKVQRIMREAAETDLNFLGFVVLENRLKPQTTPVITALNTACIKVVMVTGDNILTALSVARDCDIIIPGTTVIAVNAVGQQNQAKPKLYFTRSNSQPNPISPTMGQTDLSEITEINSIVSLETIENGTFINRPENGVNYLSNELYHSHNKYVFALTGKTWALIKHHYPELIPKIVTRGAVFARMSPDQKQQLVQELQALGYYVAMVGDGANDCGALKAAHTGISLSDTESSVASPFTSRDTNISCVLNVIREGRAALVTSFGIFKYMAAYSLTQFISVMLLYGIESNLTDIEFLYIDLGIISVLAFFFGRTAAYDGPLVKTPPLTSLISLTPILSLLCQLLLIFIFQFSSLFHIRQTEWFVPFNSTANKDEVGCLENYTIFIVSSFQYIILAVVFSKGQPYRKSIFTNHELLASFVLISLFSSYLAISPCSWLTERFNLVLPDDFGFRVGLVAYGFTNFVLAIVVEHFFIEYLVFKKLRHKWRNVDKSKRSFLRIERDLLKDQKWPPLTFEPPQETSPDIVIRQNVTEIKIEKRSSEPFESVEGLILASPENSARFCKSFGSAREVTLNPRSLYNEGRNTMSLQTVPNYYEEREVTPMRKIIPKRRHNSESEPETGPRMQETNAIATLPRQFTQQQKIRELKNVLLHKSEDLALRASVQNGLDHENLPS